MDRRILMDTMGMMQQLGWCLRLRFCGAATVCLEKDEIRSLILLFCPITYRLRG